MAENLIISSHLSKDEIYLEIIPQIKSIISGEDNLIANLANISAILNAAFKHLWTGFYLLDEGENFLVLGPFQGPLACTRIPLNPIPRGVCGLSAKEKRIIIVENVDEFKGHIACSSLSKSEIVLPLIAGEKTQLVLDIDSIHIGAFDKIDKKYLEQIIDLIKTHHFNQA